MQRVLVLGGTGFVGAAVVSALARRPDVRTRCASRGVRATASAAPAAEQVRCDVLDRASLDRAMQNIDAVVDCCRERSGEREARTHVETVTAAARAAGVRHLIYLSSIAVFGDTSGDIDESTPCAPTNWYGRAKRTAEQIALAAATGRLDVTILRLPLVYGPGGGEWSTDFIRSIAAGYGRRLAQDAGGTANLLYVDDVAEFCAAISTCPPGGGTVLTLNGAERVSFARYFAEIGVGLRTLHVPVAAARTPPPFAAPARTLLRRGLHVVRHAVDVPAIRGTPPERILDRLADQLRQRPHDRPGARFSAVTYYRPDRAVAAGLVTTPLATGVRASLDWALRSGALQRGRVAVRRADPPPRIGRSGADSQP